MRHGNLIVLFLATIQCWHNYCVFAKVVNFDLNTGQSCFKFISRFCFAETQDNGPSESDAQSSDNLKIGTVKYSLTFPSGLKSLKVLMFYHDGNSWDRVIDDSRTTCYQKYLVADETDNVYPVPWNNKKCVSRRDSLENGCIITQKGKVTYSNDGGIEQLGNMTTYEDVMYFNTNRARYFYFSLVNTIPSQCKNERGWTCDGPIARVSGTLHMTNYIDNDFTEFSYDEYGLDITVTVFAVAEVSIFILLIGFSVKLFTMGKLHITVILLIVAVFLEGAGLLVYLSHLMAFKEDGIGIAGLEGAAVLLWAASDLTILAQLILLGKGWTIVRRKLSPRSRIKTAVILTLYSFFNISFLIWHEEMANEATQKFTYDSTPGHFVVLARSLLWVWFLATTMTTIRRFGKKRRFYGKLVIAGTFWFISLPVIFLSSYIYDIYIRKKWILGMQIAYTWLAHVGFVLLYNPFTKCNKGFPFHAMAADMRPAKQVVVVSSGRLSRASIDGPQVSHMVVSRTFNQQYKPFVTMQHCVRALTVRLEQMQHIAEFVAHRGVPEMMESVDRGTVESVEETKLGALRRPPQPARGRDDEDGFFWNGQQQQQQGHDRLASAATDGAAAWAEGGLEVTDMESEAPHARSSRGTTREAVGRRHDGSDGEAEDAVVPERRATGVVSRCLVLHQAATMRQLRDAEQRQRISDHLQSIAAEFGPVNSFLFPHPPDPAAGKAFILYRTKVDALSASEEFAKEFEMSFLNEKVFQDLASNHKQRHSQSLPR